MTRRLLHASMVFELRSELHRRRSISDLRVKILSESNFFQNEVEEWLAETYPDETVYYEMTPCLQASGYVLAQARYFFLVPTPAMAVHMKLRFA